MSKYQGHTPGDWGNWTQNGSGHAVTGPSAAMAMFGASAIRDAWPQQEGWCGSFYVTAPSKKVVALALGDSKEEAAANARLLADATMLLRQRDELVDALQQYMQIGHGNSMSFELQSAAYNNANELLARIKEESQ